MSRNSVVVFVFVLVSFLSPMSCSQTATTHAADQPSAPIVVSSIPLGELHQLVTLKLDTSVNSMMCFVVIPNPSKPVCWAQARGMVVSEGVEVGVMVTEYSAIVDLAGRPDVLCLIQVVYGTVGESSIICSATV